MTDFIARLAARALGAAPVVRPRRRALFEGSGGMPEAAPSVGSAQPDGAEADAKIVRPAAADAPSAPPGIAPLPQPAVVHVVTHRQEMAPDVAPQRSAERVETSRTYRPIAASSETSGFGAAPAPTVPVGPVAVAAPPEAIGRPRVAPLPPSPLMPSPGLPVERSTQLLPTIMAAPGEASREIASPPVVEITIGRIDVRSVAATRPAPTAPREARPAPGLVSLNDYLGRGAKSRQ